LQIITIDEQDDSPHSLPLSLSLSLSLSYDQNSKVLSPSGSLMTEEDDDGWMLLLMGQVKVSD
jgi:hypothetical protein